MWLIVHPMNTVNDQEIRYRLFKILDGNPTPQSFPFAQSLTPMNFTSIL